MKSSAGGFEAETYPGRRPDGPTLVYGDGMWPVATDGPVGRVVEPLDDAAAAAPVLDTARVRFSLAYGANADPDRLVDKGLHERGALLLPAVLDGWTRAWEARRSVSTGAVPYTLVPAPGRRLRTWVLGVHEADTARLDASEGRGQNYELGRLGPVAVAARWLLRTVVVYGPTARTRCLIVDGEPATYPAISQQGAARMLEDDAPTVGVEPLPEPVEGPWPATPPSDLPLFVYGTLMPGRRRWPRIRDLVEDRGPATVPGTVTATPHGWPAADFTGADDVHGRLLAPRGRPEAVRLYRMTDDIESTPAVFRRVAVRATDTDGHGRWAAAYQWNRDRGQPPGEILDDGRWAP